MLYFSMLVCLACVGCVPIAAFSAASCHFSGWHTSTYASVLVSLLAFWRSGGCSIVVRMHLLFRERILCESRARRWDTVHIDLLFDLQPLFCSSCSPGAADVVDLSATALLSLTHTFCLYMLV